MKQYLNEAPDYIKEFNQKRSQQVDKRIAGVKKRMKSIPCIIDMNGQLPYTINGVCVEYKQQKFMLNLTISSAFANDGLIISVDNTENIIYGDQNDTIHIILRVVFNFGFVDYEVAEILVPMDKISDNVKQFIFAFMKG